MLAPLSGISDLPYRLINRKVGCCLAFTEMISAHAMVYENKKTLHMLDMDEADRPLGLQIMGGEPDIIKRALEIAEQHKFDLIDFNSACPARKVSGSGKGAALMKDLKKLEEILKAIIANTDLPATVKIRAGWDALSINAVETAQLAESVGMAAVFIHGRTKSQGYRGNVDYGIIKKVKEAVGIPVIASGDALSPELIKRMFDETGCDGVILARGALGNPWLFNATTEFLKTGIVPPRPSGTELAEIMKAHLALSLQTLGERLAIVRFRKFFAWYAKGLPAKKLKDSAFRAASADEMYRQIDVLAEISLAGKCPEGTSTDVIFGSRG